MRADRRAAKHVEPDFVADLFGFDVQIVQHFDVVRNETDRHDDSVLHAVCRPQFAQDDADVGLEPRLVGRTTAALIRELPAR